MTERTNWHPLIKTASISLGEILLFGIISLFETLDPRSPYKQFDVHSPTMSCSDCFRGGVSKDHFKGKEVTINGIRTYVAEPEADLTPMGIIVVITDAFGWGFVNNRVLSDHYAKRGFLVYCPDLMKGPFFT